MAEKIINEDVQKEITVKDLKKGQKVSKLKRLKKVAQEVIGLDVLFMPCRIAASLEGTNLSDFSLVEFLNASPGTKINRIDRFTLPRYESSLTVISELIELVGEEVGIANDA